MARPTALKDASTVSAEDYRALEQIRTRLQTAVHSMQQLDYNLHQHDTLPAWPALQNHGAVLAKTVGDLHDQLAGHGARLRALHALPRPAFPAVAHAGLLEGLLRKKHSPAAEDAIAHALRAAATFCDGAATDTEGDAPAPEPEQEQGSDESVHRRRGALRDADASALWDWAGPEENQLIRDLLEGAAESDDDDGDDADEDKASGEESVALSGTTAVGDSGPAEAAPGRAVRAASAVMLLGSGI